MLINMAYDNQHPFIGCAFSALQSEFASPRELNLQSYVAKDTNLTSNAVSNKAQIVYFVYGFTSESNREYFSKIIVTNSTPDLVFFNKKVSDDPEYDYVRILKKQNETVKGYKTFMKFDK